MRTSLTDPRSHPSLCALLDSLERKITLYLENSRVAQAFCCKCKSVYI